MAGKEKKTQATEGQATEGQTIYFIIRGGDRGTDHLLLGDRGTDHLFYYY